MVEQWIAPLEAGDPEVTATSESVTGSAAITVRPQPVASLTIAPTSGTLTIGDLLRLVATVKDAAGRVVTDRAITWVSSDPAVAAVSPAGLVTGVKA